MAKKFFEKRPDVTIVGEEIANWNKDEAMTYMETWMQANKKIDAIISMNDNMAAGALEAVKDKPEFAEIQAYGVDGTAEACLLIKDGKMTSTSLQSAYDLATALMDTSNKLLTGEETQIDMDIDCPLITPDNVDQYIEMHKKQAQLTSIKWITGFPVIHSFITVRKEECIWKIKRYLCTEQMT